MADIKHTMSLDDRRFAGGLKRSEAKAAASSKRIADSMDNVNKTMRRSIGLAGKLTGAFLGFNAVQAVTRSVASGIREVAEVTRDASGEASRLAAAWQGVKLSIGNTAIGAGVVRRATGLGQVTGLFADVLGQKFTGRSFIESFLLRGRQQRQQMRERANDFRDETRAATLRSLAHGPGASLRMAEAEKLEEAVRHRRAMRDAQLMAKQLQAVGLGESAAAVFRREADRHKARLLEIDADQLERSRTEGTVRGHGASGGFLSPATRGQISPTGVAPKDDTAKKSLSEEQKQSKLLGQIEAKIGLGQSVWT